MTLLWIFRGIDALSFLAAIYFFIRAFSATSSPDMTFFVGWFMLIAAPFASISGSYWVYTQGHFLLAFVLAAIPAIPAILYVLVTLLVMWPEPTPRMDSFSSR